MQGALIERRTIPRIVSRRLIIRLGHPDDVPGIVKYQKANRSHLAPFSPDFPPGFFTQKYWVERILQSHREYHEEKALRLFVFKKESGEVIGTANFTQIFRGPFDACYLGYAIAKKEEGKGLMKEALTASIRFVFRTLNLHRIMANYMPHNIRSGKLLKSLGFQVEGYAVDYLRIGKNWEDHVLTSLTNPDWKPKTEG